MLNKVMYIIIVFIVCLIGTNLNCFNLKLVEIGELYIYLPDGSLLDHDEYREIPKYIGMIVENTVSMDAKKSGYLKENHGISVSDLEIRIEKRKYFMKLTCDLMVIGTSNYESDIQLLFNSTSCRYEFNNNKMDLFDIEIDSVDWKNEMSILGSEVTGSFRAIMFMYDSTQHKMQKLSDLCYTSNCEISSIGEAQCIAYTSNMCKDSIIENKSE